MPPLATLRPTCLTRNAVFSHLNRLSVLALAHGAGGGVGSRPARGACWKSERTYNLSGCHGCNLDTYLLLQLAFRLTSAVPCT